MNQLFLVQILRAAAALTVVFGHAQYDAEVWSKNLSFAFTPSHLLPWGAGVDLFFVISGFIMVYASRGLFSQPGASNQFIERRFIRIVPLYWIMSSLYLVMAYVHSRSIGKPLPAWQDIVAAYLFLPVDTFNDGSVRPFYTLGWTLNYEMFFYACFAAVVIWPLRRAVMTLAAAFAVLIAWNSYFAPAAGFLTFWSQPIILEFVFGMLIAMAYINGIRLPAGWRAALVLLALAMLYRDFFDTTAQPDGWIAPNRFLRVFAWGIPAAMIMMAAVLAKPWQPASRLASFGILIGDASYALYLSHPFVIVLTRKALLATHVFTSLGGWALVVLAVVLSTLLAIGLHLWLEKPLTRWLGSRLANRWKAGPPSAKPA